MEHECRSRKSSMDNFVEMRIAGEDARLLAVVR